MRLCQYLTNSQRLVTAKEDKSPANPLLCTQNVWQVGYIKKVHMILDSNLNEDHTSNWKDKNLSAYLQNFKTRISLKSLNI